MLENAEHWIEQMLTIVSTIFLSGLWRFGLVFCRFLIYKDQSRSQSNPSRAKDRTGLSNTSQNPYPHPWARVFAGTGSGFTKTQGYPNPHRGMLPEMTNKPRKGSASVNRHCRATLRGSESHGNGNRGAEHAPQCFNGVVLVSNCVWLDHWPCQGGVGLWGEVHGRGPMMWGTTLAWLMVLLE